MRKSILFACAAISLVGCTTEQKARVETTASALCTSVPIAQTAYNVALQNHDNATVNLILDTIRISCPAVLTAIHAYQPPASATLPPAPAVPTPTPTPERG